MRVLAVMLSIVLAMTFAAPARAEAIDVMTGLAIAGAVVVVIILIAYIIVANVKGSRMDDARNEKLPVMVACAETEGQPRHCWAVDRPDVSISPEQIEPVASPPVGFGPPQLAPQS